MLLKLAVTLLQVYLEAEVMQSRPENQLETKGVMNSIMPPTPLPNFVCHSVQLAFISEVTSCRFSRALCVALYKHINPYTDTGNLLHSCLVQITQPGDVGV